MCSPMGCGAIQAGYGRRVLGLSRKIAPPRAKSRKVAQSQRPLGLRLCYTLLVLVGGEDLL